MTAAGRRRTGRAALAAALAAFGLVLVVACGSVRGSAAGTFHPGHRGALTVATSLPAPGFWDGPSLHRLDGGFEWAIATALADRFHLRLDVIEVPFPRIARGDLGGADLALSQISATADRRSVMDLSVPYYDDEAGVLVRAGTPMTDLLTARATTWAAGEGTTDAAFVDRTIRPTAPLLVTTTQAGAVDALRHRRVDAVLLDLPEALVLAKESAGALHVVARFATAETFVAALPKGSGNTEAVDSAMRALLDDGTIESAAREQLRPHLERDPSSVPVIETQS